MSFAAFLMIYFNATNNCFTTNVYVRFREGPERPEEGQGPNLQTLDL